MSIIDVETGHQPVHNEDRSIWAVFNGEIYNYPELRESLLAQGHIFYTHHSDSELIVHLYEQYGEDFAHHMNGMFAIALWDGRQKKLLLIRDRMGVKPIFYSVIASEMVFGSEIKSILVHPGCSRKMSPEAVYHYFSLKNVPSPLTAFQGIFSVCPGEIIGFQNGNISSRRYWKVDYGRSSVSSEKEAIDGIYALLEDATRLRMRSDVPFGAYLSGGVDSSSVVAMMSRFSSKPIKTFALGYEDELRNKEADLYYARKVSEFYGTEHYEYIMAYKELIDDIEDVIGAFDQPFSGTISTYFLSKLISKHVKVALSGDGADELFGSYLTHRVARPLHYFPILKDRVRNGTLTDEEKDLLKPCDTDFLQRLYDVSGGDEVKWRYNLYLATDEEKLPFMSDNFRESLKGVSTFSLVQKYFSDLTSSDPLSRILEMEWNTQLPDQALAFADSLSMAHSVEIRSPFLDYRLVEFAATIPGEMKIRNGNVKDILKKTVEPILPEGITKRPKEGFVLPIFAWMTKRLKDYSINVLSEKRLRKHDILNNRAVQNMIQEYFSGNDRLVGRIWNLMMFQLWWERYFD